MHKRRRSDDAEDDNKQQQLEQITNRMENHEKYFSQKPEADKFAKVKKLLTNLRECRVISGNRDVEKDILYFLIFYSNMFIL